jgi:hypothetical protein
MSFVPMPANAGARGIFCHEDLSETFGGDREYLANASREGPEGVWYRGRSNDTAFGIIVAVAEGHDATISLEAVKCKWPQWERLHKANQILFNPIRDHVILID